VYGVYLYDETGTLVARADRAAGQPGAQLPPVPLESRDIGEYRSVGGREVYSYFTPLTGAGGQAIGMLQVTRRASEIRDYLATLRINAAVIMLGTSALLIAICLLGYHAVIGRPLKRLASTMECVAQGDTQARAAITGPEEIRRLAHRFNSMLGGIADRDAVLGRKRAEQARLAQKLRRSEKYALVGRLAAGVAHELGTPLSVIDGQAQRLLRAKPRQSKDYAMLSAIREAAGRMSTIVRQLLGFGNDASPAVRPVAVQRLVSLAAADVRAQFEKETAKFEIIAASPAAHVPADETRMREALGHLLRNALHASCGGRVRIGWQQNDRSTRIFVENSGSPISAGDRERIFEPFFTTKEPGAGSGLGLAIVKSTVADHGAEIEVYDSPLGGAGFSVAFLAPSAGAR
jgi:signal transduction histidine kinase